MNAQLFRTISTPLAFALCLLLAACASPRHATPSPHYKIGNPYQVKGRWYYPKHDPDYEAVGVASWYGRDFHGRKTANGEIYDMNRMSAAHKTLPLPSIVEVTNLENGRKVRVRVNDRGPFARNREIDMSRAAARRLGFEQNGLTRVRVRYLGRAALAAKAPSRGERPIAVAMAPMIADTESVDEEIAALVTAMKNAPVPTPSLAPLTLALEAAPTIVASAEIITADSGEMENIAVPTPALAPLRTASDAAPVIVPAAVASKEIAAAGPEKADADEPEIVEAVAVVRPEPVPTGIIDLTKAPASALETLYVIRVATLMSLDNIEALKAEFEETGPLRVSRIETEAGEVFYRINMGPYTSIEAAAAQLEAVREAGYGDATVVTLMP